MPAPRKFEKVVRYCRQHECPNCQPDIGSYGAIAFYYCEALTSHGTRIGTVTRINGDDNWSGHYKIPSEYQDAPNGTRAIDGFPDRCPLRELESFETR